MNDKLSSNSLEVVSLKLEHIEMNLEMMKSYLGDLRKRVESIDYMIDTMSGKKSESSN